MKSLAAIFARLLTAFLGLSLAATPVAAQSYRRIAVLRRPVVLLGPVDILGVGDSIMQYGTTTTNAVNMGYTTLGEVETALARMNYPALFESYADTSATIPGVAGNGAKYYIGDNLAQAGGGLSDANYQIELAKSRGINPRAMILSIGTNTTGWAGTRSQSRAFHLALMDKMLGYWPGVPLLVVNVRPTRSHMSVADADMATNVAARAAQGAILVDVGSAYTTAGLQADAVHPSAFGVGTMGAPVWEAALRSALGSINPPSVIQSKETGSLIANSVASLSGAATANNSGVVSGYVPAGLTVGADGGFVGTVVCSVVANPAGGNSLRIDVTSPASGGNNTTGFTIYANSASDASAGQNQWVQARAHFRDNTRASGKNMFQSANLYVREASNSAATYGQGSVPLYPVGRSSDDGYLATAPIQLPAGSTGGQLSLYVTVTTAVATVGANVTSTFYLDSWDLQKRTSPVPNLTDSDPTTYDSDAQAYFAAVPLRDVAQKARINALVVGLKADGLWAKMDWLTLPAGPSERAGFFNIRNTAKALSLGTTLTSFKVNKGSKGIFDNSDGTSPGSAMTVEVLYQAGVSQFQQNSAHAWVWVTEQDTSGDAIQLGSPNNTQTLYIKPAIGGSDAYRINGAVMSAVNPGQRTGMRMVSRTASNAAAAYLNGTQVATSTTASVAPDTFVATLLRSNLAGPNYYGRDRVGGFGSGAGLTSSEAAALYARIAAYMASIGN